MTRHSPTPDPIHLILMRPLDNGVIPPHHDNCLGCGPENGAGLQMAMRSRDNDVVADLVLDRRHEGAPGLAHGGAIATALDDLFGGVLVLVQTPAVTASLNVEYRRPVPLGAPLQLAARCVETEGRRLKMRGEIHLGAQLLAEATAVFVRVDVAHFEQAGMSVPDAWRPWGSPSGEMRRPTPEG